MPLEKTKVYKIFLQMALLYNDVLNKPEGENGLLYLQSRGFDTDFLNRNMIGFAPSCNRNFIYDNLVLTNKFDPVTLLECRALSIVKEEARIVDYIGLQRVVFPIFESGNVVGFSSRTIFDSVSPKYKTLMYERLGLFNYNTIQTNPNVIYITEGAIDCLSMMSMGFSAIGLLGTGGLSKENAEIFHGFQGSVIILFDSEDNKRTEESAKRTAKILHWAGVKDVYYKYLPRFNQDKMDINSIMLMLGKSAAKLAIVKLDQIKAVDEPEPNFTYDVKQNNDLNILDVVSSFESNITQETNGRYRCICPFPDHNDTNPSFIISTQDNKNFFKCYGCQRFGGPIKFLMEYYNETNASKAYERYCSRNR